MHSLSKLAIIAAVAARYVPGDGGAFEAGREGMKLTSFPARPPDP